MTLKKKKEDDSLGLLRLMKLLLKNFHAFVILFVLVIPSGLRAQKTTEVLEMEPRRIILTNSNETLAVSMDCPYFNLKGQLVGGYAPLQIYGDIRRSVKQPVRITYAPILLKEGGQLTAELLVQWFPEEKLLRKWVRYRLSGTAGSILLKEIILDRLAASDAKISLPAEPGQSYPVFLSGFFTGIEFPVSSVRIESEKIVLAHQPGFALQPDVWYDSKKAIYCAAPKGNEKEAFRSYITTSRLNNNGLHVNYNSWWTSPVPFSEKNILGLMKTFKEKMFLPHKASFNTFCIDMGWSNPKSIWEIDTLLFPEKFTRIQKAATQMNSNLGLWISPSNMYSPKSLDSEWAERQGYETYVIDSARKSTTGTLSCLGGKRYLTRFREQLVDLVSKYEIKQLKLDGYIFTVAPPALLCKETDHGHEPGYLSIEPIAEALIETCKQIRNVSPNTWIETTCMGGNPSPWWLFYVNSVIGNYGSDTPVGRIPSPVYRESYTSARDFLNIQGATYSSTPIEAQEVLGIIHQSPESFANDAITAIMRGHMFLPLYLNPEFMDDRRWKMIADITTWAKKNAVVLQHTKVLLPVKWQNGNVPQFKTDASTMPLESYGYAHITKNKGLVHLRNPWIENSKYLLKIDSATGFSEYARDIDLVSIYPEFRVYAKDLKYGDTVTLPLAPYETLVLSVSNRKISKEMASGMNSLRGFGQVIINKIEKNVGTSALPPAAVKSKPISNDPHTIPGVVLGLDASVEVLSGRADLLVLLEGNTDMYTPQGTIYINGKPAELSSTEVGKGRFKVNRKLWLAMNVPLIQGKNSISLNLNLPASPLKVSVWALAKKPGDTSPEEYPNMLPQPEDIYLQSVNLIESFTTESIMVNKK